MMLLLAVIFTGLPEELSAILVVKLQPEWSVTVTVYVPEGTLISVLPVPAVFHE
jgi:hypothetical protein